MSKEFRQTVWDDRLERDCTAILRLALVEDLGGSGDCTTLALVGEDVLGRAAVAARQPGTVAGLPGVKTTPALLDPRLQWSPQVEDGQPIEKGVCVGTIAGPARGLLAAERTLLNLLGRLSGIATLTRHYVDAVAGTKAGIYDTRKTTPGWRRLEKYAVRCGGGWNHRAGLFEAVLIKDNHLALGAADLPAGAGPIHARRCRCRARQLAGRARRRSADGRSRSRSTRSTARRGAARAARHRVVGQHEPGPFARGGRARRNAFDPAIELEASGGVDLATVRAIAETRRRADQRRGSDAFHRRPGFWAGLDVTRRWKMPRIIRVAALSDFRLRVEFDDGTSGEIEMTDRLFGPVFEPLHDPKRVRKSVR